jgi:hypothetical protein
VPGLRDGARVRVIKGNSPVPGGAGEQR